jgi:DNA polymerase III epsilon subunit-like protein
MSDIVTRLRENVLKAQQQAKDILEDPNVVILDTETTGLHNAFICDLAAIERGPKGHNVIFNTLLNPKVRIPPDAERIHGISNAAVSSAPTFTDIWPKFEPMIRNRRIVAYNARYDLRIIHNEIDRVDPKLNIKVEYDCAMEIYQLWCFGGLVRSQKNQTRLVDPHCTRPECQRFAEDHKKAAHRAYADVRATVKRLQMVANTCWFHDHDSMER